MSNTYKHNALLGSHRLSLMLGVAFLTMGGMGLSQASLTAGGTTVLDIAHTSMSFHGAAAVAPTSVGLLATGTQLVLGLLLLLLGFLFHAWLVLLKRDAGMNMGEREVPVHAVTSKKPRVRRIPEPQWFWMEMDFEKH